MDPDDKAVIAYIAGVLTVAVVLPGAFVLAVRHIEPFRRMVRQDIASRVDQAIAIQKTNLSPIVRGTVDGALLTIAAATGRGSAAAVVNELASQPAADAVLAELGAPTGP